MTNKREEDSIPFSLQQEIFEKYIEEFESEEYPNMPDLCRERLKYGFEHFLDKMFRWSDSISIINERQEEADRRIYRWARKHRDEIWQAYLTMLADRKVDDAVCNEKNTIISDGDSTV